MTGRSVGAVDAVAGPGTRYARAWLLGACAVTAGGVALAVRAWSLTVVVPGLALDTAALAAVYGLLAASLPGLRTPGQRWVHRVVLRSLVVVSALMGFWGTASISVPLAALGAAAVALSSPPALHRLARRRSARTSRPRGAPGHDHL